MIYTKSEMTVKKYTVGQAVESAKRRLKGAQMCVNALRGWELSDKITLEQLNTIADQLISDSNYWNN